MPIYRRAHTPAPSARSPSLFAMQTTTSAAEAPPSDRGFVARVSGEGALAALLGHGHARCHAEGAEVLEDELLGRLRDAGLVTYGLAGNPASQTAQGRTPPHRLLVRLSGALAEVLAGQQSSRNIRVIPLSINWFENLRYQSLKLS